MTDIIDLTAIGKDLALEHLRRLGFTVVARDLRTRFGTLDLVARSGDTLVFCEVETQCGSPRPHATPSGMLRLQRQQVRRKATDYLATAPDVRLPKLRFDSIFVTVDSQGRLTRLDHLEDAL